MEDQQKFLAKETKKIQTEVLKMEQAVEGIPFEVMKASELTEFLKENNIKNFVDPHFPPRDSSIYE
jgi:hypothetical protein